MDSQALCSWCSFALFYVNSSHDFLPLEWRGQLSLSALLFPIPSVTWEDIPLGGMNWGQEFLGS